MLSRNVGTNLPVKFTLEQARKIQMMSRDVAVLFLQPLHFTLEKETGYSFYWRLGGNQASCVEVRKISPAPGFDPLIVLPVGSRYVD
jgi:hypothetical protein